MTPGVLIRSPRLPFGMLHFSGALGCPLGRGPQSHPVVASGDGGSCSGIPLSPPPPAGDAARGPFHYAWDLAPPYVMLLSPRLSPGPVAGSSAFAPLCRSAPLIVRLAALINHWVILF